MDEEMKTPETAGEAETAAEETENPAVGEPEAAEESEAAPEKERKFGRKKEHELKKKLEALKAETDAALAAERDKYLRLAAEYDNYRRRSQKEKENVYSDGKADTVLQLLPVYDNLERALKAECSDPNFYRGVEMTMTQLTEIFAKLGVTPIEAAGQPFDPAEHNAVVHVEDESLGENTVVEEFQKGFKLNDKVIRFAMVKVAN
ncbi:MAG: nucleotide exchange factor GrpE [Oscillospiraceae bacterium]|jgi:molecular chaperone GrpE|nr:nucleotide exchange factor GrpE [Oscillospiraceae bacterium]